MKHTKEELERGYTDSDLFSASVVIGCIILSALMLGAAIIISTL